MRLVLMVLIACVLTSIITLIVSNNYMRGHLKESEAEAWDEWMKEIENEK